MTREREWEREREESKESESVQNVKQRRSKKERMCEHRTKWKDSLKQNLKKYMSNTKERERKKNCNGEMINTLE